MTDKIHPARNSARTTGRTGRYDPGFFALDRAQLRQARDLLGGELAGALVLLAASCATGTPNLMSGQVEDLALVLGRTPKAARRILNALEAAGVIEWERASNQYTGAVTITLDLERPNAQRARTDALKAERSKPAAQLSSSELSTTAEAVVNPVDNESDITGALTVGVTLGGDQTGAPNRPYIGIEQEQEPPPTPPDDSNGAATTSGRPDRISTAIDVGAVIELAAERVTKLREPSRGPAGTGARRRVFEAMAAQLEPLALEWLSAGLPPHRIAEALAERYLSTDGDRLGNAGAVPWLPGELDEARARAAAGCPECLDGYLTTEVEKVLPNGRTVFVPFTELCSCQALKVPT